MIFISVVIAFVSFGIILLGSSEFKYLSNIGIEKILGISGILVSVFLTLRTSSQLKQEQIQDDSRIRTGQIEKEIEKYKTLIETDPKIERIL